MTRTAEQRRPSSVASGQHAGLIYDNTTTTMNGMPNYDGTYSVPLGSNGAYGQGRQMPHTAVGRIPSGPPTFDHRAWTLASSNLSGTLQSPPNHNPLYSPQTIPVGPHYVPVQPPPGFMGQYAPPMADTIQTPYSGAVPYSPSPYISHTAHSSSVPYTQGHFAHPSWSYLPPPADGHVAQSSQTRSTHLPVYNVAQSPPHQMLQPRQASPARMPHGSQTARPLLSQGSDTNMGTNAQVPSQMSLPYQQTTRSNAAASSPLSRPQTVPVPQDRQCGHGHGRTHSSPISSDP